MQSGTARFKIHSGFTLLELLVVITIIALLAALLFPAFSSVREKARQSACISNIRQMGLAVNQYVQDNDELLPPQTCGGGGVNQVGWMYYSVFGTSNTVPVFVASKGALFPYVKDRRVYICPDDSAGQTAGNSYSMNGCLSADACVSAGIGAGKSLAQIDIPSDTLLLCEEFGPGGPDSTGDDGRLEPSVNYFAVRHRGGSELVFMDGHAKYHVAPSVSNPPDVAILLGDVKRLATGNNSLACP